MTTATAFDRCDLTSGNRSSLSHSVFFGGSGDNVLLDVFNKPEIRKTGTSVGGIHGYVVPTTLFDASLTDTVDLLSRLLGAMQFAPKVAASSTLAVRLKGADIAAIRAIPGALSADLDDDGVLRICAHDDADRDAFFDAVVAVLEGSLGEGWVNVEFSVE